MTRRSTALRALAGTGLLTLGVGAASSGCLNRPIDRLEPRTTSTVVERLTQSAVDKIDLLLAIDNSLSMNDKQAILAAAVPDLVERLVKPNCVNLDTGEPTEPPQTVDAMGECPTGLKPEFPPIKDINIGIISSSLGALTANNCGGATGDDKGHLLARAIAPAPTPQTYQGKGFLAWDPDSKREPAGTTSSDTLVATLTDMVVGVDQTGCGYEMQLESVYRFLADPDPYESLSAGADGRLVENGTDQVLLTQRADFLRANSLLAVLILSDENDCSVDVSGQGYLVLGQAPFYKATDECAANPADECCTSCALGNPAGCAGDDATCGSQGTGQANKYSAAEDHGNLRCFDQKRRYGVNFLYPVERYVNAFTLVNIDPSSRTLAAADPKKAVKNPIFQDLSGAGVAVRDPGLVFVAGIVGIPWQYLARGCKPGGDPCPGATPDLQYGFKSFNELAEDKSTTGSKLLDALIGDPDKFVTPEDPFMRESVGKRQGSSVVPGLESQSLPGTNALNGNDRNIPQDDLQYACIFDLDADSPDDPDCGDVCANDPMCDDPLCDPANKAEQIKAKAYPGLRELALLRGMGNQGIFASICPAQTDMPDAANYGYRPAVGAIIDRLKQELGGQCLPRKLNVNPNTGQVPCLVLEATVTDACNCDPALGRKEVDALNQNAVKAAQQDEFAPEGGWNCFCEIVQFACPQDSEGKCVEDTSSEQYICQNVEAVPTEINGWCYVDATPPGPVGNPDLVADCADDEKRLVRFVNKGLPQPGATVFVTCTGDSVEE